MIVAIDESGDFAPGSNLLSFFVAVELTQHNDGITIKEGQFNAWLSRVRQDKINKNGEVKGSDLSEDELLDFARSVMSAKPSVRISYVQFRPSENPEELMKEFKAIEVARLEKVAKLSGADGKVAMSKQYTNMAIWQKNAKKMHYQHYMKLVLLRSLVTKTFTSAVAISLMTELLGEDPSHTNILNIEYKIDRDFIRGPDPEIFWKELLRNSFRTEKEGIPVLDEWNDEHPFLVKYKPIGKDFLNFSDVFNNHCSFYDSHDSFEVQMADLTAAIINRFSNRKAAEPAYRELWSVYKRSNRPTHLVLNKDFDPNIEVGIIVTE